MKKIIAVIGDCHIDKDLEKSKIAFELGKALIDNGYRVLSGGRSGVMSEAMRGAKVSALYHPGDTIAILPTFDRDNVNPYADIIIPTGLDIYRNVIIANSDAVIAIGGGAGTLIEMANAWNLGRLIIAYANVEGWSAKLAGTAIDHRRKYKEFNRIVYATTSDVQSIGLLEKYLDLYNYQYKPLK